VTLSPTDPGPDSPPTTLDERQVFLARVRAKRPRVTVALLVLLGLVFALELRWGATESSAVLGRMGAMLRSRLLAGEWWRLMSSGVLHGSGLHFLLNAYVLWVLGRDTERLLGSARFLVLYVASALLAALGSAMILGDMSVGASGAIWGLLGAQAVFAFGARGHVPSVARQAMQKAAASNLALNVVVSFMPHVDWVAHFAGGATGAALVASGLLLRGLPRLADPEPEAGGERGVRRLALGLGLLYVGGAACGVLAGKAWAVGAVPVYVERELAEFGAAVEVPALLGEGALEHPDGHTVYTFGDESGPLVISIQRLALEPRLLAPGSEPELAALRGEASRVDEGETLVALHSVMLEGRLVSEARSRLASGLVYDVTTALEAPYLWRVEVLTWPDFLASYAGAARRVVTSLHTAPVEPRAR